MTIIFLCEGDSERALKIWLKPYLDACCLQAARPRVKLVFKAFKGTPNTAELRRRLDRDGSQGDVLGVVCLIDVYPDFADAAEAITSLRSIVKGSRCIGKFYPHAAQMELEAWLLPFWNAIALSLGVKVQSPGGDPEKVDGQKPPSKHLRELYNRARRHYSKPLDTAALLKKHDDIETAAAKCPQLARLLITLKQLAGISSASE